ncbi:tripartite tricarboxylate transporter TctB family protein [Methylobacterium oryzisoli]|uniref:tripartite tricarboxylate transporter TctB family protein n=1 Tax=Methylobacterium oryzisoli TaxID=3385502 RepID=UPI00389135FE
MAASRSRAAPRGGAELWAALAWLLVSLGVVWAGRDLGIGEVAAPGSGFLLFWAGLLMAGFSVAILWTAVTQGSPPIAALWAGTRWRKVVLTIASLAVYAAILDGVGFLPATIPLMLVLLRGVDPVRWRVALPVAILSTVGIWWVLKRLLHIQLPAGAFGIG